jgi:hypothetical protein
MDAAVLESRRQNQAVTSAFGLQTAVGEVHPQALARPSRATQVVPVSSKNSRVLARGCATDSSTGWTGWALSERGNRTHQPQKQRRSRLGPGLLLVELRGLETPDPLHAICHQRDSGHPLMSRNRCHSSAFVHRRPLTSARTRSGWRPRVSALLPGELPAADKR